MANNALTAHELAAAATAQLERLIAFDTTSRCSNLDLIAYVEGQLAPLGIQAQRVVSPDGTKANLYATLGPMEAGGVVLSGHTDVVPVDGQDWSSDPFTLTQRDGRLYGRGTSDMKAFLALALAAAPTFAEPGRLRRPVHLAFSYDEEVGCLGAPYMIREMAENLPQPAAVIVGEPTSMEVVGANKGIGVWRVTVTGHEAHSSQTHRGLSANIAAVRLMGQLVDLSDRLKAQADSSSPFEPPYATLTIGRIDGGTAANILAGRCQFVFDLRHSAEIEPQDVLAPFMAEVARMNREMESQFPEAGVSIEQLTATPPLALRDGSAAETLVRSITGDNGPVQVASFAAEAGQFQQAGFATVLCGPGSIDQAHQPDEFIAVSQMERGAEFMLRLAEELAR